MKLRKRVHTLCSFRLRFRLHTCGKPGIDGLGHLDKMSASLREVNAEAALAASVESNPMKTSRASNILHRRWQCEYGLQCGFQQSGGASLEGGERRDGKGEGKVICRKAAWAGATTLVGKNQGGGGGAQGEATATEPSTPAMKKKRSGNNGGKRAEEWLLERESQQQNIFT